MSVKKRGLGRGLDALLGSAGTATEAESEDVLKELPLSQLVPGKHQPRRHFDEAFDNECRFRTACAAIGVDRRRVRVNAINFRINGGNVVLA